MAEKIYYIWDRCRQTSTDKKMKSLLHGTFIIYYKRYPRGKISSSANELNIHMDRLNKNYATIGYNCNFLLNFYPAIYEVKPTNNK